MQRFIRLWHKMDWTIDETDQALIGSSELSANPGGSAGKCDFVGLDAFQDVCSCDVSGDAEGFPNNSVRKCNGTCAEIPSVPVELSPGSLHQLVAVRKLIDQTGLPLDKLLTFWANISTAGEKSLYARLFLTHNILGIDEIFKSDSNGNYLTQPAKLSEHMPVLMAALKLKFDDVAAVMAFASLADALTLASVSTLYRHSLLAKILHVPVADLSEVFDLFGNPFNSAQDTLALLQDWGNMEDTGFTFPHSTTYQGP